MPLTSERSIRWASARGMNGGFIVEPTWALKRNVETYYDEAEKQGWPDYQNRGQFKYGWDAERKRGVMVLRPVITDKHHRAGDRIASVFGSRSDCSLLLLDTSASNGICRAALEGSVAVAAGGSALFAFGLGGLAADRAPAGREEMRPLMG